MPRLWLPAAACWLMAVGRLINMAKVTSQDVAKLAGVSQSAVSRVFTPGASVSKEMADKVRQAADELGYRPNILARSLITGNSRIIGVVVSYLNNQFYPEILEILSAELRKRGYHPLMFMASENDDMDEVMSEILDYQVDGVVLLSVNMSSALAERCRAASIPVVLFNRYLEKDRFHAVTTNNYEGGSKVAELFIAAGHQRIGYIAGWEETSTQRDREKGFVDTLKKAGIELFDRQVGNYNYEETIQATRTMFTSQEYPDAVFFANDHMAFAALGVLEKELGLKVPEDVSVVGFDDVPLASWPVFNLTTVRQPAKSMVAETIRLLFDVDSNASQPIHIEIDGPLMIRNSAKVPQGYTS